MAVKVTLTVSELGQWLYGNVVANVTSFIFGHPGLGKSEVCETVANKLASRFTGSFIPISTTEFSPLDMRMPYVVNGVSKQALSDFIPLDRPVFILIDEFGDCPQFEQSGWYRLLNSQTIGNHKLCEGSYVCAASNRPEDSAASREISTAAKGRCNLVTLRADYRCTMQYARAKKWDSKLVGFINAFGTDVIDNGFNPDCPYAGSTPRDFARLNKLETANAISSNSTIALAQIVGNIGESAGAQYFAFRNLEIPSPELVYKTPKTAPVFEHDVSLQFAYGAAVVGALRAEPQLIKAFCEYAGRLDRVTGFGLCLDAKAAVGKEFTNSTYFAPLAVEYGPLLGM